MTVPALPAPPAVFSGDFGGLLVPPDVQAKVLNLLVDVAPFSASLTRAPTSSNTVSFPVASPSGAGWIAELGEIPLMTLGDGVHAVAVCKLAGLLDVSNELVSDASVNITAVLSQLLADSLGPQLDDGLLTGSGPPEPVGVVGVATAVDGPTLFAAAAAAVGQIGDSGGTATKIAASGAAFAAANASVTPDGVLIFPAGVASALGLQPVTVPGLVAPLVYDSTRLYTIVNGQESSVDISRDYRFAHDASTLRIKARVAVGCPAPAKTIRKLTVTPVP